MTLTILFNTVFGTLERMCEVKLVGAQIKSQYDSINVGYDSIELKIIRFSSIWLASVID